MKRLLVILLACAVALSPIIQVDAAKKKTPTITAVSDIKNIATVRIGKSYFKVNRADSKNQYYLKFRVPKDGDYKFTGSNGRQTKNKDEKMTWIFSLRERNRSIDSPILSFASGILKRQLSDFITLNNLR